MMHSGTVDKVLLCNAVGVLTTPNDNVVCSITLLTNFTLWIVVATSKAFLRSIILDTVHG